jgi:ferrochelatase
LNKAVLLLNLGTPAEPTAKGLRQFYKYFFADPFVFDIPAVGRWLLRNLIILPFRAPKTAKQYEKIWMEGGSPLKVYTERMRDSLEQALADQDVPVLIGMAYSAPFIHEAMDELRSRGVTDIVVLPLFPQYSTATTASVFHAVRKAAAKWPVAPNLTFIDDLFEEPAFIRAWAVQISRQLPQREPLSRVEHVIFSYHGLPERNLRKADQHDVCRFGVCCASITDKNRYCYRAQCMATTRGIVSALGWPDDFYSVAFQSRFGKEPWIQPYLDEHIEQLAKNGIKRIAVATPSFVSDCLETIHEIGIEYAEQFVEAGGEELQLIPNLNDEPFWFNAVADIVRPRLAAIPVKAAD